MVKELIVSVISGIIVAIFLQILPFGRRAESRVPAARPSSPRAQQYAPPPPRRRSFLGTLVRFVFSVAGGIGLAFVAAPLLRPSFHRASIGGLDHFPMLAATIIGTVIVWVLLSAMTRR